MTLWACIQPIVRVLQPRDGECVAAIEYTTSLVVYLATSSQQRRALLKAVR
jgi:hypothetical protein